MKLRGKPPVFRLLNLGFWKPENQLTHLMKAGVLYQEASERKENLMDNGSKYQQAAITVSEGIDNLPTRDSTPL